MLSIGKIFVKQFEVYDENQRETNYILPFMKTINNKIIIDIPTGYNIKGLEKLKFNNQILDNSSNEPIVSFISDYEIINNQLVIKVIQKFEVLTIYEEIYKEYKKILNSINDFNKIVLVLESNS